MRTSLIAAVVAVSAAIPGPGFAEGTDLGKNEYVRSCASCHGEMGKGDGPAAKSLAKPPADLTKLSQNNSGVFPIARVYDVIDGRLQVIMHGTREMPVWGDVFRSELMARVPRESMSPELRDAMVRVRILMVIEYISKLQGK
jgi:mono/diheme cytochrome c family protein